MASVYWLWCVWSTRRERFISARAGVFFATLRRPCDNCILQLWLRSARSHQKMMMTIDFGGLRLCIHWHQSSPSCVTIYRFWRLVKFKQALARRPQSLWPFWAGIGMAALPDVELNWIELKLGLNWKPILLLYFTEHGNSECNSAEYKKRKRKQIHSKIQ